MNSERSNSLSLKYQRFTPPGRKDIGTLKFKFEQKHSSFPNTFMNVERMKRQTPFLKFQDFNLSKNNIL